jgi:ribose 5-phosphate isomerase B
MRIAIASDHAALALKSALVDYMRQQGHDITDLGPHDESSVDYPDYGYKLAAAIADGDAERGIALCGSGIGISIAVNRNPACRAALVSEPLSAQLAREHNDANVIAMGARLTGIDMAKACVDAFLPRNSAATATSAASINCPTRKMRRNQHEQPSAN